MICFEYILFNKIAELRLLTSLYFLYVIEKFEEHSRAHCGDQAENGKAFKIVAVYKGQDHGRGKRKKAGVIQNERNRKTGGKKYQKMYGIDREHESAERGKSFSAFEFKIKGIIVSHNGARSRKNAGDSACKQIFAELYRKICLEKIKKHNYHAPEASEMHKRIACA